MSEWDRSAVAAAIKAVSTAKTAVGMTKPMEEMPETSHATELRRGLSRRAARASEDEDGLTTLDADRPRHQPSLEPLPRGHQPSLDDPDDPTGGH